MVFKESEMLNAWLWEKHRTDVQWRRVRLGPLPTKEAARIYMTLLRWADAIYLKDGIVHIVEAKLRPMPGAFGQLELYEKLFRSTLEFTQYKNWPIQKVSLNSIPDILLAELASEKDIAFVVFSKDDVNETRRKMMLPIIL